MLPSRQIVLEESQQLVLSPLPYWDAYDCLRPMQFRGPPPKGRKFYYGRVSRTGVE